MDAKSKFVERPLTAEERHTVRWLLEHGAADAAKYLPQLDDATVADVCGCGCASIDFAIYGNKHNPKSEGMHILSDYSWIDDKGHAGGIFVFSVAGQLAGLDVYSADGKCDNSRLPDIAQLM